MSNKFAFIAIVMLVPVCCYAGENRVDAALISQVETTTRQEYNEEKEKLLAKIRERKANLDEKDISLATDWPKSALYNKAYALFLSVKEAVTFPAFGFLNQTNGPNALYDFDGMYSCLMSSVR